MQNYANNTSSNVTMGNSLALQIPASVALLTMKRISLTHARDVNNNSERGGPSITGWWRASGEGGGKFY